MASTIDLTNQSAKAGAMAALDIILKSRKSPIPVEQGGGSGNGPQLKAPKHTQQATKSKPTDEPNEPGQPGEDKPDNKPGTGQGTKVTKTSDGKDKDSQEERGGTGENKDNKDSKDVKDSNEASGNKDSKDGSKDGKAGSNGDKSSNGDEGSSSSNNNSAEKDKANAKKNSSLFDKEKNEKTLQGIKDDMWAKQETEKVKANQENGWDKMVRNAVAADFSELENDLYYAIAAQVGISKTSMDDTWDYGEDPAYADSEFMFPQQDFDEKREKPLIYVFFDQSGSFDQWLIDKGKSVLKVLDDFIQDGLIMQPKLFVFGNNVAECDENGNYSGSLGGGTHGWPQCMNIIKQSQDLPIGERCTNVLVLSDSDIQTQTNWHDSFSQSNKRAWNEKLVVEGCIFWCWANNDRGKVCEDYLKGDKGNFVYQF